jgi:hypothetical protein
MSRGFGVKKGWREGKLYGETEENPSAARVCNEGRNRGERGKGRGRSGEGLWWRYAV